MCLGSHLLHATPCAYTSNNIHFHFQYKKPHEGINDASMQQITILCQQSLAKACKVNSYSYHSVLQDNVNVTPSSTLIDQDRPDAYTPQYSDKIKIASL